MPRDHSLLPEKVWAVEEITDAPRLTIRQWHERYRTDRDHRRSDHWPLVLLLLITAWSNAPTLSTIYEESGSDQGAADKAINRWLKAGRIVKKGEASMNSATGEPSALSKVSMLVLREVREVWGEIRG